MRTIENLGQNWTFTLNNQTQACHLPHTWNAKDGQDGKNDYYRGQGVYQLELEVTRKDPHKEYWLEIDAAATIAKVSCNGHFLQEHKGGYSRFRVNVTDSLAEGKNLLQIEVDNSYTREVYPQKADFTFYGGIYREVKLITLPKAHFDLSDSGSKGFEVWPSLEEGRGLVSFSGKLTATVGTVLVEVLDQEGVVATQSLPVVDGHVQGKMELEEIHLWQGLEDPYLYTIQLTYLESGDQVSCKFGFRTMEAHPEKGFLLNGKSYPLVGAAKHQDYQDLGPAIGPDQIKQDCDILLEMGGNTLRAAHYQHDQSLYDYADEKGIVIWAEIPYITEFMSEARDNAQQQLTELIKQNQHHASIFGWALSNEITATGGPNPDLLAHHQQLNELAHRLDPSRPTLMAHVFMLDSQDALVRVPDVSSYNLYYGWYLGDLEENDRWFDRFKKAHPELAIGLSEYGADANPAYHSLEPEKGDYTEEYQALYHEHMMKMWEQRPYIWAMHVWNLFDFGADGRDEGGKPGQNQKGLVTFDRKIRKDAFYLYKAYLSKEPFVHLCGKRFTDRPAKEVIIKAYSNQKHVSLWKNGQLIEEKIGHKVFEFKLELDPEQTITVKAGKLQDSMVLRRVETLKPEYICPGREVINWFERDDMHVQDGYYSIKDSANDIMKHPHARQLYEQVMNRVKAAYGEVAQNISMPKEMEEMLNRIPVEKALQQAGNVVTPEMVVELNRELGKIKKIK